MAIYQTKVILIGLLMLIYIWDKVSSWFQTNQCAITKLFNYLKNEKVSCYKFICNFLMSIVTALSIYMCITTLIWGSTTFIKFVDLLVVKFKGIYSTQKPLFIPPPHFGWPLFLPCFSRHFFATFFQLMSAVRSAL